MKAINSINSVSELSIFFEKVFDLLNEEIFGGELPKPIITLAPTKQAYGHYTPYEAWNVHDEPKREINISTYDINRPIEKVITTEVHEMCHLYNDLILGVKDCSNNGRYHNAKFKRTAEEHWLIVEKSENYGWCITKPSEKLLNWINAHPELKDIEMYKKNYEKPEKKVKKKPNRFQFKYKCPNCGSECKATAKITVFCTRCNHQMY